MSQYQEILTDLGLIKSDFRINDLDESLEVKINGLGWQRINDTLEAIIKTDLREIGYGTRKKPSLSAAKDAYTKFAHVQRYNPIKEYFLSLDGKYEPSSVGAYYCHSLTRYFTNPDGQFESWLFKWMVGVIAKVFDGQRNPMLVLVAPQRIGKSFFAGWICPIKDKFIKSSINPDSKDANLRLADVLIWEAEELGATTRRSDIESLKAFITKPFIYERPPYGKHPIFKPANASFIGTVNYDGAGFLNDPTGSTRFLSCEIEKIDYSYTEMDVNDLWAEAYWYYKNIPSSWELTEQEQTRQAEINEKFETVSALADVLETYFELTGDLEDFMTTQEIRDRAGLHYRVTTEQAFYNELGRVLKKLGCEKDLATRPRGWRGIKVKPGEDLTKTF
jgi:predicted P-loop ATPase